MTQERLRELLRERVAEESMPDVSERAWQRARVVRRRRRLGAAAGVVAATVGVSGGLAVVDSTPPAPPSEPGISGVDRQAPDATYQGVPVWWSPDQIEEQSLPTLASPLPEEIDLRRAFHELPDDDMDRAYAVFVRGRAVVLIGPDGQRRWVRNDQVHEVIEADGYRHLPVPVLADGGTRLVFAQEDGRFAIYYIAERTWTYDESYAGPGQAPDPGFDTRDAQRLGPVVDGAAGWGMGVPLPVREAEDLQDPPFIAVPGAVLAIMWKANEQNSRWKSCCQVAGWLDDQTVVYESRQGSSALIAWRVDTHDFRVVTRIDGRFAASAFAL
jgi:hypothetical protein